MISSKEIFEKWQGITAGKCALKPLKCFILAIMAGMFIGFGGMGATLIQSSAQMGLNKLLGASVFPVGLMMVVMAGGELFTGNCLMVGQGLCGRAKWNGILKNLLIAYIGNMLGAFLVSVIAACGGVLTGYGDTTAQLAMTIAKNKVSLSFMDALLKGIGCNILVCAGVWMASGASSAISKAALCFFPVMLFVLCGLEHSIANMYYIPAGMLAGADVSIGAYLMNNLLPVTLGNVIGGAGFAAAYCCVYRN
ncbi:MAG: formate/nitrite transporter family protein [Clostridia bacterium]|nr:formate/nitrite transporter family protein [Clostridia bacterium]